MGMTLEIQEVVIRVHYSEPRFGGRNTIYIYIYMYICKQHYGEKLGHIWRFCGRNHVKQIVTQNYYLFDLGTYNCCVS